MSLESLSIGLGITQVIIIILLIILIGAVSDIRAYLRDIKEERF